MRFTIFLLTALLAHTYAASSAQNVTLSGTHFRLEEIFTAIEKQTGYVMFSDKSLLANQQPIALTVHNLPLRNVLDIVFKDLPLKYDIQGKTIFISAKPAPPLVGPSIAPLVQPDFVPVKGRVTDSSGAPLQGVSISVKRGDKVKAYAITNENGEFSMDVLKGDLLEFSFLGFERQTAGIGDNTWIAVVLHQEKRMLAEVQIKSVNTGYQQI